MKARPATADELIEAYVVDVIRRLPRRQRNDVGFELRALLNESLRDRAAEAGKLPDEAMALAIVREFGRPDEVAERYSPPGVPIIPPAHTAGFAWATAIGVAVQWATTLPLAFSGALAPGVPESSRLAVWWLSFGLGALWWPGFLVTVTMIAGFIRQRWPAAPDAWTPRVVDRDHVNRPLYALGLAAALAGIGLWVALAWWATTTTAETPLAQVFQFDPDFLATRAPVVLLYWAVGIVLLVIVIAEGRWRMLTRRLDMALKLVCCAMLAWIILGGRIFIAESTNAPTEGVMWLLILGLLADVAWSLWRSRRRIRPPAEITQRS
jgi:hypothetical protein